MILLFAGLLTIYLCLAIGLFVTAVRLYQNNKRIEGGIAVALANAKIIQEAFQKIVDRAMRT